MAFLKTVSVDAVPADPFGATADAAVAAGASGSMSAKLRRLTQGVEDLKTLLVLAAGSAVIGKVGVDQTTDGTTNFVVAGGLGTDIVVTPTVSSSPAYTAGDAIGGKQTLAHAVRVSGGTAILQGIMIADKAKQSPAIDVFIFNADPGSSTFTDNGALTIADADLLKLVYAGSIAAADWKVFADNGIACLSGIGKALKASGSTSLYACLVARSTPTFASTSDIQVIYSFLQN